MATDPFRSLFLRQIRVVLSDQPSRESLRQLLTIVSPELADEDLDDEITRTKLFRELRARVHPDKHPNDESATSIFQDIQPFYDSCCSRMSVTTETPRRNSASAQDSIPKPTTSAMGNTTYSHFTSSSSPHTHPTDFVVTNTWPFMSFHHPVAPNAKSIFENSTNSHVLEILMAYRCINSRGAVAHGAKPALFFGWSKVLAEKEGTTAQQFFHTKYRGARQLETVDTIKEELQRRGPVVSVSFVLSPAFAKSTKNADAFYMQRIHQTHALLIVGWKLTAFGEVWLVYPPDPSGAPKNRSVTDMLIPIAVGQYHIDTLCLAPESALLDKAWQEGPFLDLNLSQWPDKWMSWKKCDVHLTSNELQRLSECLGVGFVAAATSSPMAGRPEPARFVLRDEKKLAHSRAYRLKDVQWNPVKKMWKISIILQSTG